MPETTITMGGAPEHSELTPDCLIWKDEGLAGPLWYGKKHEPFPIIVRNYQDAPYNVTGASGRKAAKWYSEAEARVIATQLGLEFREV